jgi:hypothetical protein
MSNNWRCRNFRRYTVWTIAKGWLQIEVDSSWRGCIFSWPLYRGWPGWLFSEGWHFYASGIFYIEVDASWRDCVINLALIIEVDASGRDGFLNWPLYRGWRELALMWRLMLLRGMAFNWSLYGGWGSVLFSYCSAHSMSVTFSDLFKHVNFSHLSNQMLLLK